MAEPRGFYKVPIKPNKYRRDSCLVFKQIRDSGFDPDFVIAVWRGGTAAFMYVTDAFKRHRARLGLSREELAQYRDDSIKASSYEGVGEQHEGIEIYGIAPVVDEIRHRGSKRVLVGDDIFDTGITYGTIYWILKHGVALKDAIDVRPRNTGSKEYTFMFDSGLKRYPVRLVLDRDIEPLEPDVAIKSAMPYWKPHANQTQLRPDYYVKEFKAGEEWLWRFGRLTRWVEGHAPWLYNRLLTDTWPWLVLPHEFSDLNDMELRKFFPDAARILLH